MSEALLWYGFPSLIGLSFVSFVLAWILAPVNPPADPQERHLFQEANPNWTYWDAAPEGIRRNVAQSSGRRVKTYEADARGGSSMDGSVKRS